MKTSAIFVLTVISTVYLFAQVHFPLGKGDNWVYQSYVLGDDGSIIIYLIDRDTTIQGKQYSVFGSLYSPIGSKFLRQENSKVLGYDQTDSSEYVVLDFLAKEGDTISIHSKKKKIIIALGNLQFKEIDSSNGLFPEEIWTIKDSIGVINIYSKPGYYTKLISATINGKTITSITNNIDYLILNNPILYQNYPNPFNPSTTIKYSIPYDAIVSLKIYDLLGRELVTIFEGKLSVGNYTNVVQLDNLSSGVYCYRLQTEDYSITKKLFLLK